MADKKYKSQAERAASSDRSNKKNETAAKKGGGQKPEQNKNTSISPRFYSGATFAGLFVLFLVILLNPEGSLTGFVSDMIYGLVGAAGFIISIPVFFFPLSSCLWRM